MKLKKIALIGLTALSFAACKKVTVNKVEKNITKGSWTVSLFSEEGTDETYYFTNYTFTFKDDKTVTAVNGSITVNGTWEIKKDNSNDDSSSDVDFILSFPATNNFDELTDDWDIVTQSDNTIELIDVSGGNGGTDLLTFKKK